MDLCLDSSITQVLWAESVLQRCSCYWETLMKRAAVVLACCLLWHACTHPLHTPLAHTLQAPQTPYSPCLHTSKSFIWLPLSPSSPPSHGPTCPFVPRHTSDNILTPLLPSPSWEVALMSCCLSLQCQPGQLGKTAPLNPDLLIFQVFKLWLWISPVFPCGLSSPGSGWPKGIPLGFWTC